MMWILMRDTRKSPPYNADRDLIMEWLVDFVLTHCNFWRGAARRGKRNREEERAPGERRLLPDTTHPERGRVLREWHVWRDEGRADAGAPYEEYPSQARNLFVGRPQTVRRYCANRLTTKRRRRENVKPIQRARMKTEGNAGLANR